MTAAPPVTRFRKRPVVVEARRVSPGNFHDLAKWCDGKIGFVAGIPAVDIPTLEGTMTAVCGDWIVKGIAGEFHPVRGSIFARTYDPADGLEGKTPGQAVYEARQAFMIRYFPGMRPIGWGELSEEGQAEREGIARAGIAAYIEANGRDPVDAASVIAEAIVPELAAERERADAAVAELGKLADSFGAMIAGAGSAGRKLAEAADAKVAEAREVIGNFLAQYGDSEIPMFKVAQDLATSLRKILGDKEVPGA